MLWTLIVMTASCHRSVQPHFCSYVCSIAYCRRALTALILCCCCMCIKATMLPTYVCSALYMVMLTYCKQLSYHLLFTSLLVLPTRIGTVPKLQLLVLELEIDLLMYCLRIIICLSVDKQWLHCSKAIASPSLDTQPLWAEGTASRK